MSYNSYDRDALKPGAEMRIERHIYFETKSADISQLTALPLEQLQTMREESATAEQAIFANLQDASKAWEAQAGQTLSLNKAIEYVRTPQVQHTSNEWQADPNNRDRKTKSNEVYAMSYHVYERTRYDRETEKSVPVAWELSWSVRPQTPGDMQDGKIAGQDKKLYTDRADMEKYLAGREKAHAHLFTEISPPIPPEHAACFKVNGQLLPGYTVAGEEPKAQEQTTDQTPQQQTATKPPEQSQTTKDTDQPNAAPAVAVAAAPFVLKADNPRDKLKEITDKLETGVQGIFQSEQYKRCLETFSKFHNYSLNNCLLIAMQKPNATRVAGFNAWQKDFKRQVQKGEKGIKIIAPAPFKAKKEVDKLDAKGKPVMGADGKPVKEEKEITIPAFTVATVFDVSQTDGEPLPTLATELTGSVEQYKEFFAAVEKTSPVPVDFEKIPTGAKGYFHFAEKRIAIQEGMSELQNVKTLIHEIAHARIHDIDKDTPLNERPDSRTREVEAESIAYTVCQHYGLDTSDYSFGYIAGWSGGKELDVLKSSLDTIRKEADAIIGEVDKQFAELTQNKEQIAEQAAPEVNTPAVDLKTVADYFQKQNDTIQAADPNKAEGQAAFAMGIKRLEQANERIPNQHPELKALLVHAAQSPDLPTLKERMNTLNTDFIQHHSTAVQNTIDQSGKAEPPAAAPVQQGDTAPPKAPAQGENVAAIEAKVKAGETINLTDLSDAMKKDKQAGQTRAAATSKPKEEKPSIRQTIATHKQQLAEQKPAPQKTNTQNKGLGD